ncbi:MAG: hypothetical protein KDA77_20760, partial [Planctomycetaceae bacterium]|nr:hypothetical protein [Planctomycetaceae bacterium]
TFYSADFLSGSGSATESVLFSRATHNGDDVEVRVGVKGILFSYHSIWSGELKESLQRVGFAQTHRQEICDDLCFAKLR